MIRYDAQSRDLFRGYTVISNKKLNSGDIVKVKDSKDELQILGKSLIAASCIDINKTYVSTISKKQPLWR